jgi:hypothetical protein
MQNRKTGKIMVGVMSAIALAGCAAEGADVPDAQQNGAEQAVGTETTDTQDPETGLTTQALGSFSHHLPRRGSEEGVVETMFLGYGMMYELSLRTGALVDAVSASFYVPSSPSNQHTPGDKLLARGPAGGSAGSLQPKLVCPGGYAAHGLYGQAGKRIDLLGLVCARIARDGRPLASDFKVVGAYGGTGGTFFYDTCGEDSWLAGMIVGVAPKSSGSNKVVSSLKGYCGSAR